MNQEETGGIRGRDLEPVSGPSDPPDTSAQSAPSEEEVGRRPAEPPIDGMDSRPSELSVPTDEVDARPPETPTDKRDSLPSADEGAAGQPAPTGHPAVDEVLASLARLDDLPVDEHVAAYERAHEGLRRALSDGDGPNPDPE